MMADPYGYEQYDLPQEDTVDLRELLEGLGLGRLLPTMQRHALDYASCKLLSRSDVDRMGLGQAAGGVARGLAIRRRGRRRLVDFFSARRTRTRSSRTW